MTIRLGDTTNRVAGALWRAKGCRLRRARMRLLLARAVTQKSDGWGDDRCVTTHVFLLLVDVTDLEPDIGVSERTGRVAEDAIKAREAVFVLALLLVDDAEAEEDFVYFIEF